MLRYLCSAQKKDLHLIAIGACRANSHVAVAETGQGSWQDALGEIQLALNCTPNRVTKISPLELGLRHCGNESATGRASEG